MHLEGQFAVAAHQDEIYAYLTDPAKVSRYMPDVKDVTIDDADHFTVTARVGVSHIRGTMVMKLEIRDRRPPISTAIVVPMNARFIRMGPSSRLTISGESA